MSTPFTIFPVYGARLRRYRSASGTSAHGQPFANLTSLTGLISREYVFTPVSGSTPVSLTVTRCSSIWRRHEPRRPEGSDSPSIHLTASALKVSAGSSDILRS